MISHLLIDKASLRASLVNGEIKYAGNLPLKIYGTLHCTSGKRMKKKNRVFFKSETEALEVGFRPCGRCLPDKYRHWKKSIGP